MNAPLVTLQNVTKQFTPEGPPALSNISATLNRGQIIGLAGPDAAGKTTLMRLIAALFVPTSGTITIEGLDTVRDAAAIQSLIGYMPQKFGLYEDLTVMQNLNLYADLRGLPHSDQEATFKRLLDFTDLNKFTDRLAGALSGGMKQKLGLACALMTKPTLLLLDEPTVGVDPVSRRELWKMVQELLKEQITVIWSTAYLDEAERTDSVLLLNEGKLLYSGPPRNLTDKMKGRTFLLRDIKTNKRPLLKSALSEPEVIDGVIQGANIRLVVNDDPNAPQKLATFEQNKGALVPTPPRFEDAFISILGGGPGGSSALADNIPPLPPVETNVIKADHLTKMFGNFTAVDHISFNVQSGEIFGLLGPNGAGKSTTFKMLCGLLKPTSGNAWVNGIDLQVAGSKARSQIGYMAQKFSQYGDLSTGQNLEFFAGIYGLENKKRQRVIDEMVSTFNLGSHYDVNAGTLPPGFKQRLALACAVMHHPPVLFLDEPTSGVDPITRREFWNHINGLVEKGVTVLVTTHFMDEAEYCDRIALVYQGQVIQIGSPEALKKEAVTPSNANPTMEDAFITLIEQHDGEHNGR